MASSQKRGSVHCAFCGKTDRQIKRLIAGQEAYICDECVKVCYKMLKNETEEYNEDENPVCSFCGKSENQVDLLIFQGKGYICDKCLKACNESFEFRLKINDVKPGKEN